MQSAAAPWHVHDFGGFPIAPIATLQVLEIGFQLHYLPGKSTKQERVEAVTYRYISVLPSISGSGPDTFVSVFVLFFLFLLIAGQMCVPSRLPGTNWSVYLGVIVADKVKRSRPHNIV